MQCSLTSQRTWCTACSSGTARALRTRPRLLACRANSALFQMLGCSSGICSSEHSASGAGRNTPAQPWWCPRPSDRVHQSGRRPGTRAAPCAGRHAGRRWQPRAPPRAGTWDAAVPAGDQKSAGVHQGVKAIEHTSKVVSMQSVWLCCNLRPAAATHCPLRTPGLVQYLAIMLLSPHDQAVQASGTPCQNKVRKTSAMQGS